MYFNQQQDQREFKKLQKQEKKDFYRKLKQMKAQQSNSLWKSTGVATAAENKQQLQEMKDKYIVEENQQMEAFLLKQEEALSSEKNQLKAQLDQVLMKNRAAAGT